MSADPTSAVQEYLRSTINGVSVYGEEVPREQADNIPFTGIVVATDTGPQMGLSGRSYQHVGYHGVEIRCYAETPYDARQLNYEVFFAMRDLKRYGKAGYSGLFNSIVIGGPMALRDPDTKWPFMLTRYRVMAGEVENAT